MLLKRELLNDIKAGKVDLVFRRWNRPTVRAGGTLKTKVGLLSIRAVTDMRPEHVSEPDARRAGFRDLEEFRRWLDGMKQGTLFQRIEVGFDGEPEQG